MPGAAGGLRAGSFQLKSRHRAWMDVGLAVRSYASALQAHVFKVLHKGISKFRAV